MKNNSLIKKIKSTVTRLSLLGISAFAFMAVLSNVNVTCDFIVHQPKLPEGAKKLRKF